MKVLLEIPDGVHRTLKAVAGLEGKPLKQLLGDSLVLLARVKAEQHKMPKPKEVTQ